MLETRNRIVRHTQEETTRWTLVRLAKARASKAKASTARAKTKGNKDSKDSKDRTKTRTRTRIRLNVGIVEKRGHYSKDCWSKKDANKGGPKGKHRTKNATDAHNLDSTKPANAEPKVEIGGFDMIFLDVDALQQQESEWIKIGVDTGAGKTAWPQSVTYGKKLPGHVDLTFRTATGELVQALVCKPLLSVEEYTTTGGVTVLCGDKGYLFHKGSKVAKKIDAWIQKDMRDSQYHGCTVAYKENNV